MRSASAGDFLWCSARERGKVRDCHPSLLSLPRVDAAASSPSQPVHSPLFLASPRAAARREAPRARAAETDVHVTVAAFLRVIGWDCHHCVPLSSSCRNLQAIVT
ncbi:hypothetical protein ACQJBY_070945 [Aegilops geniculata]